MRSVFLLPPLLLSAIFSLAQLPPQLVYISSRGEGFDIFAFDLETETERRLTTNPGWDWGPQFNPALKAMIYNRIDTSDNFSLGLMASDGTELEYDFGKFEEYILSPDGQRVLVTIAADDGDTKQIVMCNPVGGDTLKVTDHPSYNNRPLWSPDGRSILFLSNRDGDAELFLYDLEGGSCQQLTQDEVQQKYCTWSPDGKQIAYTVQYYEEGQPDRNDVFMLDLATGNITRITDQVYNDVELSWSPDGRWIAFHSTREDGDQIYLMRPDGSGVRKVTTADAYHGEPTWIIPTY